ncbi:replication protein A 70 kDa DNA-binding subunit B, partial [Tanacetum coccineum]
KEGFDPNNHSIALFSPVKKEVTADEFFKGAIKKMVGSIRDSDSHSIVFSLPRYIRYTMNLDGLTWHANGVDVLPKKWINVKHHPVVQKAKKKKFKVNVRVIDVSGSASLLLFDDLVFKLGGEQCYNLIKKYGENHDEYFPDELNVLVGKRLLWRFHYTDEHIINNNYVYQVKLLSKDEDWIIIFKKDFVTEAYLYHPHLN